MIVTTVPLVRTTSVTARPAWTTAFHPAASAWAETRPLMMFCRSASNAAPVVTHVSPVRVRRIVEPPVRISSSLSSVTVPDNATVASYVISNDPSSVTAGALIDRAWRKSVSTRPGVLAATLYHTVTASPPAAAMPVIPALSAGTPCVTPLPTMESIAMKDPALGPVRASRSKSSSTLEVFVTVKA